MKMDSAVIINNVCTYIYIHIHTDRYIFKTTPHRWKCLFIILEMQCIFFKTPPWCCMRRHQLIIQSAEEKIWLLILNAVVVFSLVLRFYNYFLAFIFKNNFHCCLTNQGKPWVQFYTQQYQSKLIKRRVLYYCSSNPVFCLDEYINK